MNDKKSYKIHCTLDYTVTGFKIKYSNKTENIVLMQFSLNLFIIKFLYCTVLSIFV